MAGFQTLTTRNRAPTEAATAKTANIADLRLFWYLPGDKLRLQLYSENFSDEQVLNSTMIYNPEEWPEIATFLAVWGDPTRYGLTLSYHY